MGDPLKKDRLQWFQFLILTINVHYNLLYWTFSPKSLSMAGDDLPFKWGKSSNLGNKRTYIQNDSLTYCVCWTFLKLMRYILLSQMCTPLVVNLQRDIVN